MKPARTSESIKETERITVQDVLAIFNSTFNQAKTKINSTQRIFDLILSKAEELYQLADSNPLDIKFKICISIAIRLLAEKFALSKITDQKLHSNIHNKQTGHIVGCYKKENPREVNNIAILDRVNLMTAENIHINSFMYEPLMDLTDDHLKTLFKDVKTLS